MNNIGPLDLSLINVYKKIVGLVDVTQISRDTIFNANVSANSFLNVSNQSFFMGDVTLCSSLNVSGTSTFVGNSTVISLLYVSGTSTLNNTTINSNLFVNKDVNVSNNLIVNNNSIFNNSVTLLNQLNVSGTTTINGTLFTNNINAINNGTLNINSNNINIGNLNSQVFINGTVNYVATTDLKIIDKLISLNLNEYTLGGNDIGDLSGFEILGISGTGFIKTTSDASNFQIKAPLGDVNYILTVDSDNNMNISNTSLLNGNVTILSSLNVSGITLFQNDVSILSTLNVLQNVLFNNNVTIGTSLNVSGNANIYNNVTITSSLYVSGNSITYQNTTIQSNLNVSGNTIFNSAITLLAGLNVSGYTTILGATTILSSLNVSGNTNILSNVTMMASLNVSGTTTIKGNCSINSTLNVSGNCILNNSVTITSSLTVGGDTNINSTVTMNSNLNILSQMIASLPNYINNITAKQAGVPVWGWYRSGGIIKIRLDDTPPVMTLSGNSIIALAPNTAYIDPGVYATSLSDGPIPVYLTSISNGNNNIITTPIPINGINTSINETSILSSGSYTATYVATDSIGNSNNIYRILSYSILSILNLDNNVRAYYKLNESVDSTSVIDSGPNSYNGTVNNSVLFGNSGKVSTCATFNGNNWIILNPLSVNNLASGTIMCWIKPSTQSLTGSTICAKQQDDVGSYSYISIGQNWPGSPGTSGLIYYYGPGSASSLTPVIANQWNHIAIAFTSSQILIYINGNLDKTTNVGGSIPNITAVNFIIGTAFSNKLLTSNSPYVGAIDEFAVFNSALSSSNITSIYNAQLNGSSLM